jgi:hypothetical protein
MCIGLAARRLQIAVCATGTASAPRYFGAASALRAELLSFDAGGAVTDVVSFYDLARMGADGLAASMIDATNTSVFWDITVSGRASDFVTYLKGVAATYAAAGFAGCSFYETGQAALNLNPDQLLSGARAALHCRHGTVFASIGWCHKFGAVAQTLNRWTRSHFQSVRLLRRGSVCVLGDSDEFLCHGARTVSQTCRCLRSAHHTRVRRPISPAPHPDHSQHRRVRAVLIFRRVPHRSRLYRVRAAAPAR